MTPPKPEPPVPSPQSPFPSPGLSHILIVRLGSLGDIVHGLPVAAALRETYPRARLDWLVDRRNAGLLELVPVVDRGVVLERPTIGGWIRVVRELRQTPYDVAIDLQGLLKSAALARLSGAGRVVGFETGHLREAMARPFYSEAIDPGEGGHVVFKNLLLLRALGIEQAPLRFPFRRAESPVLAAAPSAFALINPGAAWPNKRWPPERFGVVAAYLKERFTLSSIVLWGPGEEPLAQAVVEASKGAARVAPRTTLGDLVELSRVASLMVSGDTGPLHIAAAMATPIVSLFGPTDPQRNGPWSGEDEVLSRWAQCECPYQRRCRHSAWCLEDITVGEVTAAIERRLAKRVT